MNTNTQKFSYEFEKPFQFNFIYFGFSPSEFLPSEFHIQSQGWMNQKM